MCPMPAAAIHQAKCLFLTSDGLKSNSTYPGFLTIQNPHPNKAKQFQSRKQLQSKTEETISTKLLLSVSVRNSSSGRQLVTNPKEDLKVSVYTKWLLPYQGPKALIINIEVTKDNDAPAK
ncbi:hypothetical protein Tco_0012884 [Tanacetum coccineum]